MMEKEISETYFFRPLDFDEKGRRIVDGLSFRDIVKKYELHNASDCGVKVQTSK